MDKEPNMLQAKDLKLLILEGGCKHMAKCAQPAPLIVVWFNV